MNGPGKYQKGKTIVVEEPKYQPDRASVHVIYSDVIIPLHDIIKTASDCTNHGHFSLNIFCKWSQ